MKLSKIEIPKESEYEQAVASSDESQVKKEEEEQQEEEQQEEEEEEWAKFITTNRFVDNTVIGYATEIWQIKLPKSIETINDFSSKNYHDIIQSATRAIGEW